MKRFWSKVKKTSHCWHWQGGKFKHGYGAFWFNGKNVKAHRFSWEQFNGRIPKGTGYHGICVCHACDNPSCVNPKHLFLGTNQDNRIDCVKKNRHNVAKGMGHYGTFFKNRDIKHIRSLYEKGSDTQQNIADKYGVSRSLISMIVNRVVWKHI